MKTARRGISQKQQIHATMPEYSPLTMESVFNTLHEGVFIYDIQRKSIALNPAALKMHGLQSLKDVQHSLSRLFFMFELLTPTGEVLPMQQWPLARILRGESFSDLELIVRRKDLGWEKYWSLSGARVFDQNGKPKLAVISIQDITQRKQTEHEFRTFFDNAAVGNAQVDLEGRFIRVNERMCEITGYKREELLQMSPMDITHPDDCQKEQDGLTALIEGKSSVHKLEKRYIRKDGKVIWVQVNAGLVRDMKGKPLRTVATIRDITEEKQLTDDLASAKHEAEERSSELSAAMESLAEGVVFYDNEHQITHMNSAAQKILGFSLEEAQKPTEERIHLFRIRSREGQVPEKTDLPGYRAAKGEAVANEKFMIYPKGSDTPIHILSNAAPIKCDGKTIGVIQTITDISDTLDAIRQAQEANRAKSQFLANISHELRTPMTSIMGMLDLTLSGPISREQRYNLETAREAADSLLFLINDLLDLTRIEAQKFELSEEPFDLWQTLNRVMELLSPKAKGKNIGFGLKISTGMPKYVSGDAQRLKQVLINLLDNAIKFTSQGEVSLIVEAVGKRDAGKLLRFTVRDTGIGIPEGKIQQLFSPFQQLDQSLTRKFGGMGLGLTISREIVHRMGGEIDVNSTPGSGSQFSFTVCFAIEKAARPVKRERKKEFIEKAETFVVPTETAKILIAEDEPTLRKLIQILFLQTPWKTETVKTGKEAVERWKEGQFEMVLMDVQMPEMDGLEATRAIRTLESKSGKRTPIVALTAHARKEEKDLCLAAGMDDCLTKPFKSSDLFTVVQKLLLQKNTQK